MILWYAALVAVPTSTAGLEARIRAIVDGRDHLPGLAEVQAAAEKSLELTDAEEAAGWSTRARLRGLIPSVEGRFGTDADLAIREGIDTAGWTTLGRGLGLDVSAKLVLGDLVFSDLELRASRERTARSAAIRLAKERVTRLYFLRVRVLLELDNGPSVELLLEAARLDGLLNAATGGTLGIPREKHR